MSFGFGKKDFGSDTETDTDTFSRYRQPIPNFGLLLLESHLFPTLKINQWFSFLIFRFYNDSVNAGAEEYIPKKLFVVGGDESGETTTCHGDSGSPVVRRVASSRIGTRLVITGYSI